MRKLGRIILVVVGNVAIVVALLVFIEGLASYALMFREIEVPTSASARLAMTRTTISSTRVKPLAGFLYMSC